MSSRLIPTIVTLFALVSCYFAYNTLAVPSLLGPPAATVEVINPAPAQVQESAQLFGELIHPIFPEGSWERSCEIVLRNQQVLLFVGGYEQLDRHRLQISPCTIVLRPQGLDAPTGPDNRTWIMQAPDKTILQMEKDADIRRGSLGRIESAYIPGDVNIRCGPTQVGADDQIELATSHLQISAQQIWTPYDVRFRWGANFGAGSDLTIRFSELQASRGQLDRLPQTLPAGVRSVELVRIERLHIESQGNVAVGVEAPVEVTCEGSLKLDMMGGLARMNENVKIERFAPGGQVDALVCDELTARFSNVGSPGRLGQSFRIERIVATGEPATVTSSQMSRASPQPQHHFTARRMEYQLDSGEFQSGPGQYTTRLSDNSGRNDDSRKDTVEVAWQKSMRWHPTESGMQLTLDGPAKCSFGPNRILANRLRIWFEEPAGNPVSHAQLATQPARASMEHPQPRGRWESRFRPRRVMADDHVQINTPQLVASTDRLDAVLKPQTDAIGSVAPVLDDSAIDGMQLRPPDNRPSTRRQSLASTATNRLQVYGQTMRLLVEQQGTEFRLRDVTMDGNVRCATAGEDAPSIELLGRTLIIRDLDESAGVATIAGAPAKIRGRGMDITGPTINLDRTGNRVWIDGAGSATLPLPRTIAARYPSDAAFADILWQDGMSFDGQTIRCARNVNIRGPAQMIRAQSLEVTLDRPIDFSQTHIQDSDVDLQRISADGGVTIENRTLSGGGLQSIDSAAVETLTIEYPSGNVVGQGPGWLETVRMEKAGALGKTETTPANSLIYLRVEFQRQVQANLAQREAVFSDRIQAKFGPVRDWNDRVTATEARALAEGQLLLNCDRLSLLQIQNGRPGKAPVELIAEGNTTVEGNRFTARAARMSYDQGKDLFVMKGARRAPAQLWRQTQPGAPRQEAAADEIHYSPKTGDVHMKGMKVLNLGAPASRKAD